MREAHLEPGEELSLLVERGDADAADAEQRQRMLAPAGQSRAPFRAAELLWPTGAGGGAGSRVGDDRAAHILYLSDYLLVVAPRMDESDGCASAPWPALCLVVPSGARLKS